MDLEGKLKDSTLTSKIALSDLTSVDIKLNVKEGVGEDSSADRQLGNGLSR